MSTTKLPRGEGSISFIKERGVYQYKKTIKDINGKSRRVAVYGKTERDCLAKMKYKEKQIAETKTNIENSTLLDKMLWWCDTIHRPTVKPQTNDRLRKTITNQIGGSVIANVIYKNVTTEELQSIITTLNSNNYSYSTIKKTYDALRAFYNYISLKEQINNPMNFVIMPRKTNVKTETRKITWFEQDDIDKFCNACDAKYNTGTLRFKYGYALAANIYLGLRIGELLALTWKDIDFDNDTIIVWKTVVEINNPDYDSNNTDPNISKVKFIVQESTKTNHRRIVPINNIAKKYLLSYKNSAEFTEPNDYVISTKNRKINTAKNMSDMIRNIENYADTKVKDYNTHILRHTCASLYFKKGVPVEIISRILGNSREVCEQTYIHFAEEQLKTESAKLGKELLSF